MYVDDSGVKSTKTTRKSGYPRSTSTAAEMDEAEAAILAM